MQDLRLLHRLVCGLIRDASGKTGGRRDAKPPLVNRLVRGLDRDASRKTGGGRRDAGPPLVTPSSLWSYSRCQRKDGREARCKTSAS